MDNLSSMTLFHLKARVLIFCVCPGMLHCYTISLSRYHLAVYLEISDFPNEIDVRKLQQKTFNPSLFLGTGYRTHMPCLKMM